MAESVDVTSLWHPLFERIHWSPSETLLDFAYLVNSLVPFCIGYAVVRQRVLPVDFVVNRGLTLGIVWAVRGHLHIGRRQFVSRGGEHRSGDRPFVHDGRRTHPHVAAIGAGWRGSRCVAAGG